MFGPSGDERLRRILLNEGAGTRTRDLRIKSPLLYRLSYAFSFSHRAVPAHVTHHVYFYRFGSQEQALCLDA
jgi:hypothetical protein